jgi:hypothetical protein
MLIKGKATPITVLWGPEGSGRLRLQISRHSAHEGGKVVTLTHGMLILLCFSQQCSSDFYKQY